MVLSPDHFDAVTFGEVRVGDALGFYTGSDIPLVRVESVEERTKAGAYVVLLEGGGLQTYSLLACRLSPLSSQFERSKVRLSCLTEPLYAVWLIAYGFNRDDRKHRLGRGLHRLLITFDQLLGRQFILA